MQIGCLSLIYLLLTDRAMYSVLYDGNIGDLSCIFIDTPGQDLDF